jgi:hypothetical protein
MLKANRLQWTRLRWLISEITGHHTNAPVHGDVAALSQMDAQYPRSIRQNQTSGNPPPREFSV